MKIKSQKGIALPLVMLIIMTGALIIPSFIGRVGNNLLGSRYYRQSIDEEYAADSGAEHAVWNVDKNGLGASIPHGGNFTSYSLGESINGLTADIEINAGWDAIAWDNFETGDWAGGTGWLNAWAASGGASVSTLDLPYEGSYHLRLTGNDGVITRSADTSGQVSVHLRFWAKAGSFAPGDNAVCRISPDGNNWTEIQSWDDADSDGIYHYYDLNLTSYGLSSNFRISFSSSMDSGGAYLAVDDVKVTWPAGTETALASDDFENGDWAGGTGWLDDWLNTGNSSVTSDGAPYAGLYHLLLQSGDGYAAREIDLAGLNVAHLSFRAKVNDFESGDTVVCQVSSDGSSWQTVYTWTTDESDNTYHYYFIDLSGFDLTGTFWLAFSAAMNQLDDYFYVDDVAFNGMQAYCISSGAGNRVVKAAVDLTGGAAEILCWWFIS